MALLAAVLGSGCGSLQKLQDAERSSRLTDDLRVYGKLIRWGHFVAAQRYVRPRPTGPSVVPKQPVSILGAISVTHYRLAGMQLNPDGNEANISHELRFFHQDDRREVAMVDLQLWWWDDEASRWFLDGNIPDFSGALRVRR